MKRKLFTTLFFIAIAAMFIQCQKAIATEVHQKSEIGEVKKTSGKSESKMAGNSPSDLSILLPTQYRKNGTGYPKNVKDKDGKPLTIKNLEFFTWEKLDKVEEIKAKFGL